MAASGPSGPVRSATASFVAPGAESEAIDSGAEGSELRKRARGGAAAISATRRPPLGSF